MVFAARSLHSTRRRAHGLLAACTCATIVAAWLFHNHPPGPGSIYPACLFFQATGLLCPGCGATRALAAILRGDLHAALADNGLLVVLLPVALGYGLLAYSRAVRGLHPACPRLPSALPVALSLIALAFAVARNLP